jgi:NADH-quinone oxidoreductase subunit F
MGTAESPGNVVCTVVGDVVRPGVAEIELGTSLAEAIASAGGGMQSGRTVKAVFSGVSNPVVTRIDIPVSYEGFAAAGSGMGATGFIVYDDTACMVEVARLMSRFLYVESCGQCPPCKLGSAEMTTRLERIEAGVGTDQDIDALRHWIPRVTDGNRCYLAVEEQSIVSSIMREFADEFAEHLETGRCPRPRPIPLPKVVDMNEHGVVYDERQYLKQPDWTYIDGGH